MGVGFRFYLFEEDGSVRKISQRVVLDLIRGDNPLPDYASSNQKIATAYLDMRDGKPARIEHLYGEVWTFDAEGQIRQGLLDNVGELIMLAPDSRERVVSLDDHRKRRDLVQNNRWELSPEQVAQIEADLWPKKGAKPLPFVSASNKKPPPLTFEARHVLTEITGPVIDIDLKLGRLTEPALKGLAHEARNRADDPSSQSKLWLGVADAADAAREIRSRNRTGRGPWYAVVEISGTDPSDPQIARIFKTWSKLCRNKRAADDALLSLVEEHLPEIKQIGIGSSINAYTVSELEFLGDVE